MSWGSDKRHCSHLPLPPGFFPFAPTRSCDRLAAALARHMLQKKSFLLCSVAIKSNDSIVAVTFGMADDKGTGG